MGETDRDWWLVVAGFVYPAVAFGVLLGCGGPKGPLAFHPLAIPLPAVLLAVAVVGLRDAGVRLRWWAVALFLAWLCVCVFAQWLVWAEAVAAV